MQPRAKVLNERFGDAAGQEQYDLGTTIIRIVCQLLGPSTPFPAFDVPLGLVPVENGYVGHFNSLQFSTGKLADGGEPGLEVFPEGHHCVSTVNAEGTRFWHGHVTPKDVVVGHEKDFYLVNGKKYRRALLVIDGLAVRPVVGK